MLVGLEAGLEPKKSEAFTSFNLGLGRPGLTSGFFLGAGDTSFTILGFFSKSSSESESEITFALFFLSAGADTLAEESFLTGGLVPPFGPKKLRISILIKTLERVFK